MQKRHWIKGLGRIPVAIATTEEDVIKLKTNDTDVITQIINGNIRLALTIAGRFAAIVPSKADDIGAVALATLVEIVNGIAQGRLMQAHNNLTAYLSQSIIYEIRAYTNTDYTMIPKYYNKSIRQLIKDNPDHYTITFTPCELNDEARSASIDHNFGLFLRDLYSSGQFTEEEKKIIALRLAGYNDVEIGGYLHYTSQYIGKKRAAIAQKVRKLL